MPSNFVAKGAEGYDASMGRWSQRLADPFLDFVGVPDHGCVLDAGSGTGSLTLALAAHSDLTAIEALDFSDDFILALRSRTSDHRVTAQQGDVCSLPYEDASFDAAYSLLVLHFVTDTDRAVREMRRVLRPGAVAGAAVWAWDGMPSWRLFWDSVIRAEPEAAKDIAPRRRPMTGKGELYDAFKRGSFTDITESQLTIRMEFANFEDFWYPTAYGQGRFGAFFDELPRNRRRQLVDEVRSAYCRGGKDGPRGFPSTAWAIRATA